MARARHLDELTLLDIAFGRGTRAERAHARRCGRCAASLQTSRLIAAELRRQAEDEKRRAEAETGERAKLDLLPVLSRLADLARDARPLATTLVKAALEGEEALERALSALEGDPRLPYALVFACQAGRALPARDPYAAIRLAEAAAACAVSLPDSARAPVPRAYLEAKAALLESHAHSQLGLGEKARALVALARDRLADTPNPYTEALCDYFDGTAASMAGELSAARRLLRRAAFVFRSFGAEDEEARAEAALATVYKQMKRPAMALRHFSRALKRLDPVRQTESYATALLNKAATLADLRRLADARQSYLLAQVLAERGELANVAFSVAMGLAELLFLRADHEEAIARFSALLAQAEATGLVEDALFCRLYLAECSSRVGRRGEMNGTVRELLAHRTDTRMEDLPPWPELEELLNRDELTAEKLCHVRTYFSDVAMGRVVAYQRLLKAG